MRYCESFHRGEWERLDAPFIHIRVMFAGATEWLP